MDYKFWFKSFLIVLIIISNLNFSNAVLLRGVTIRNWPYANKLENGQFEGFVVDLLNEISRVAKITYTLKLSSDGQYGGWTKNGTVNGMIGEVYRNETDFAIGDITVLTTRDRYVNFSYPFMKFGLSALIHKDYIGNMTSFKDLSEQTEVPYGVKKVGANLPLFHDSPIISKMYSYMDSHPSTFVKGEKEGIKRVKTSKYAFITESPFNEYIVNRDCDLRVIDDNQKHFQFEYAIAMRKDSLYKDLISNAIRELKRTGKLKELIDKYWISDKCITHGNVISETHQNYHQNANAEELHSREVRDDKKKSKKKSKNSSISHNLSQALLFLYSLYFMTNY